MCNERESSEQNFGKHLLDVLKATQLKLKAPKAHEDRLTTIISDIIAANLDVMVAVVEEAMKRNSGDQNNSGQG